MGKYAEDAKELLELVGGKGNIAAVSHCMTRMRFALSDPAKADVKKIEAMKVVKGSFTQSGQFQVIIGNTVADFYNDFVAVAGIEGVSKDAVKQAAKQNQNVLQRIVTALAEIFAPLIPAIITGGLILGFRNCIDSLYLFENGTKTLCDISQFWAGIDSFLWLIGEAVFHMLPVGICWSVTKKMGTTQMLGIVLGLTLVSGQLLNAYAVAGTAPGDIPVWNFGSFQVNMIGYQAQVIPAILAAFTLVYLERFFRKITPQVVSMIVVPFCSLLLAVIAAHFILGPVGWKIGSVVSSVVYAGITGSFKFRICAPRYYGPSSYVECDRLAVDCGLRRNDAVADDCIVQYRPRFCSFRNDRPAKKRCGSAGSQCSGLHFLLPWCNGTGDFRRKSEVCLSFRMRHDRFRLCGSRMRGYRDDGQCNRSRRAARHSFDPAELHGQLCHLYGDCGRGAVYPYFFGWEKEIGRNGTGKSGG